MKFNESLMEQYLKKLKDPHNNLSLGHINRIDYMIRTSIGKTDDINVPLCSHKAIINRELGERFCRVCQKDLSVPNTGRINDYLILRHPRCQQPICIECAKTNPDEFYKSFKEGIETYKELSRQINDYRKRGKL